MSRGSHGQGDEVIVNSNPSGLGIHDWFPTRQKLPSVPGEKRTAVTVSTSEAQIAVILEVRALHCLRNESRVPYCKSLSNLRLREG